MGAVPNAVFERIMEAVNANRSAEVITAANQLLDAGNSAAQLARQCVRYLRNSLIAKIAEISTEGPTEGVGTELLQISPDEQRRAARTAALFGEEELTRFLQVMLRTFDELGYRQEQRFHFELGLLKLVHLRRLLPIEEALSQATPSTPRPAQRTTPSAPSSPRPGAPSSAGSSTAGQGGLATFSPFEQDKSRRRPESSAGAPISVAAVAAHPITEVRGATAVSVAPASRRALEAVPAPMPITLAADPTPEIPPTHAAADDPQRAVVDALAAASLSAAADAMADAAWTLAGGEASVQTELSKTMLPAVMNPEAEKIVRATLRHAGIHKLTLQPGAAKPAAAKKPRPAREGTVHSRALEHPMVQQAQKLFDAEVQTVIDLRDND
jgi:DNA polymerase-3 subunit gamma/tau